MSAPTKGGSARTAASLRQERADDTAFIYRLFAQTRAPAFAPLPLTQAQLDALLRQQFQLQAAHYRHSFPAASFCVIEREASPIGRLYVDHAEKGIHVIDVTLLTEWQGRGIGGDLLSGLLSEAAMTDQTVGLHVERENPARRLYQRLGFRVIRDKDVYLEMEWRPGRDDRAA